MSIEVVVTDHAVIRYMERAMNLNVEVIREHISSLCGAAAACGASAVLAEGVKFAIVEGRVVSVTPDTGTVSNLDQIRNQLKSEKMKNAQRQAV